MAQGATRRTPSKNGDGDKPKEIEPTAEKPRAPAAPAVVAPLPGELIIAGQDAAIVVNLVGAPTCRIVCAELAIDRELKSE